MKNNVLILSKRYGYSNALINLWECGNLFWELLEKLVFKVLNVSKVFRKKAVARTLGDP